MKDLEYFTSRLPKETLKDLKKYATDNDKKVYQALDDLIKTGLKSKLNKKA